MNRNKIWGSIFISSLLGCAQGSLPQEEAGEKIPKSIRFQQGEAHPLSWDDPFAIPPEAARTCVSDYSIQIDARYSPEDMQAILSAWAEWKAILGDTFSGSLSVLDLSGDQIRNGIPQDPSGQDFQACTLKIILHSPPESYLGWTVSWMMNDSHKPATSRIWFVEGLHSELRHQVFTHELGHFLGVPHSKDSNSVMNPDSYPDSIITEEDKHRLCSIWGC